MLNAALLANALSCVIFGMIFVFTGPATAMFLGDPPVWLVRVLGMGLFLNSVHLVFIARQAVPKKAVVMYFVMGDALWVIATVTLSLCGIFVTSTAGSWATMAVAISVAACGIIQLRSALLPQASANGTAFSAR